MTRRIGSPAALVAGFALLVIANAIVLGAAAWNRRGGPLAEIELTERELALPLFREKDDTGVLLSLVVGSRPPAVVSLLRAVRGSPAPPFEHRWLDRDKLRTLGFDVDLDPADPKAKEHYEKTLPRRAFVALEFDGDAWTRWLSEQEERVGNLSGDVGKASEEKKRLELDRAMRSRLIPVDAATDAASLERRYPDRRRHAVLQAVIRPAVREAEGKPAVLRGEIFEFAVPEVQVPRRMIPTLERFFPGRTESELYRWAREQPSSFWPDPVPPRYRAVLAIGRRHEPWLVRVTPIETPARP